MYWRVAKYLNMLSGSVAMGVYVLPRATRDFDFIVELQKRDTETFAKVFKEGYYCDADSIAEAISKKGMFNIIDQESGYKAAELLQSSSR